jgi:hypothetical protein
MEKFGFYFRGGFRGFCLALGWLLAGYSGLRAQKSLHPLQPRAVLSSCRKEHMMKKLILSTLLAVAAVAATAQNYSIDWFTIDGGGGTSTGGAYFVSGTIGQADAGGPMTNGQYSVTGGFWALPTAMQVLGAPTLRIVPAAPGNATISWTPSTPGFVLQETGVLLPQNWTNSPSGAANPVTVPATTPRKFYRLFKP